MFRIVILPALAIASAAGSAVFAQPAAMLYEETIARQEEKRICCAAIWMRKRDNQDEDPVYRDRRRA